MANPNRKSNQKTPTGHRCKCEHQRLNRSAATGAPAFAVAPRGDARSNAPVSNEQAAATVVYHGPARAEALSRSGEVLIGALGATLLAAMLAGRFARRGGVARGALPRPEPPGPPAADQAVLDLPAAWAGESLFCPVCRSEFLPGTQDCEDCAVDLVEIDDLPEREVRIRETLMRVANLEPGFDAVLVGGLLESHRIPCDIMRSSPFASFGAQVFVFESDAVRARRVIRGYLADRHR